MNTSWYIAKQTSGGSKNSFSRFIVRIAIAANALSVAVMVTALCMTHGFTAKIKERVFGFWGHVQIRHFQNNESYEETPITESANLIEEIEKINGVRHISPYIHKAGISKTKTAMEGIVLKGVSEGYDWAFLNEYIRLGRAPHISSDSISREILISTNTSRRLETEVGDALIIYFLPKDGGRPIGRRFSVSGLYHTGLEEYDLRFALGDIRVLQELNEWDENMYSGYEVRVNDLEKLRNITRSIYDALPPELNAENIRDAQPNIFDWLDLLIKNEVFALVLMMIVAILNMTTALMILILDRTRMIGILKALGAANAGIRKIFIYQAMIILSAGLFLGNTIGLGICWLQKTFGFIKLDEASYYFTEVPVKFDWVGIIGVNIVTVFITLIVLLLPTMIIAKISPVKAIRYD